MSQKRPEQSAAPKVEKPKIQQSEIRSTSQSSAEPAPFSAHSNQANLSPPSSTSSDGRPFIYAGVGIGLILLAVAVFAVFLYAIISLFFLGGEAEESAVVEIITPTATAASEGVTTQTLPPNDPSVERSLAQQANNPPAAPLATRSSSSGVSVPGQRPQLLANSSIDYASTQGVWEYLWAAPGSSSWQPMIYESRQYGTCWYAADYVRICQDSAHPGTDADIAWRWISPVPGPIEILIRANKIDAGGDGVTISVFKNTTDVSNKPLFSRLLTGDDEGGFANRFIVEEIEAGDFLLFVIQKNDDVTFDHTAFQVTVCRFSCP